MKNRTLHTLLLLSLFVMSCSSTYYIYSDYEKEVDFHQFRSFQIVQQDDNFPIGASPIHKQRIDRAIAKEMATLGFQKERNPDLLITWFVKVDPVRDVHVYRDYYGRWKGSEWTDVNYYKKGTFVVDIIERNTKQVIWHGTVSDQVYNNMPNVEDKIKAATAAMFEKFAKDARLLNAVAFGK
ncbi:MAG: DUF4136 domain-containing protein [Bacteroidota bacterium]